MKKITKKKTLTAVTGATVIGVAAAALVNGSKLDSVFNPGKFEKFERVLLQTRRFTVGKRTFGILKKNFIFFEKKQTLPVIM